MSWNEVVLEVSYAQTVRFSDALLAAGAMAVTVEDADAGTDAERPIFGEPGADSEEHVWRQSRVIALISTEMDTRKIISLAAKESGMETFPPFLVREVPTKDWVRETQAQFDPILIGKNIWVVPSWHQAPENGIVLQLDPGLAFGTGSHPTTRLCLEWLEENVLSGHAVLDYGCGSGILAIAASKLGAALVDGVDIDPQAIITARENAKENQCNIAFFLPGPFQEKNDKRQYDIIAANILSAPLQQLAPTITAKLKPGGKLVLSGILDWQEKEVISAYSPWLHLSRFQHLDGWVALAGTLTKKHADEKDRKQMILITKCPHCQTSFRVTEDQLKLYDGAVRCGVCQQIFNGVNHLQAEPPVLTDKLKTAEKKRTESVPGESNPASAGNLSGKEPEKANAPAETTERHSDDIAISLSDEAINTPTESEALFDALEEELSTISLELGQVTGQLFGNEPEDKKKEVIAPAAKQRIVDNEIIGEKKGAFKPPVKAATTRFTSLSPHPSLNTSTKNTVYSTAPHLDDVTNISPSTTIEAEVVEPDEHLAPARHQRVQRPSLHDADPLMDKEDRHHPAFFEMAEEGNADNDFNTSEPSFVRLGRKKKRFGFFSGVFLGLATLVLLATLAIQCLYMFSDRIVVWWPPAESTVAKACNTFSCPRRLETRISSLSIESSEFQVIPPLTDKYALSLLVRNSGSSYQSWPYIELTLNDKDKTPIVRRAFAPANYLPDAERIIKGIPPYSEEPVRLYLEIKTAADADYRISLFYP